jgi:RNA polymerase sigma-70 factor, ECF subfamily
MNEILRQIAAGNPEALAALYDQTSSFVFSVAMRILRNRADAEEVTLDVYTYVWREAGKFNPERGRVLAWLAILARTRSLDRLRALGSQTRHEVAQEDYGHLFFSTDCPERASFLRQEQRRIRRALALLSPEQREVIELAFFSGFTHTELAAHLQQPLGTVKSRIRTALEKLRSALDLVRSGFRAAA